MQLCDKTAFTNVTNYHINVTLETVATIKTKTAILRDVTSYSLIRHKGLPEDGDLCVRALRTGEWHRMRGCLTADFGFECFVLVQKTFPDTTRY